MLFSSTSARVQKKKNNKKAVSSALTDTTVYLPRKNYTKKKIKSLALCFSVSLENARVAPIYSIL